MTYAARRVLRNPTGRSVYARNDPSVTEYRMENTFIHYSSSQHFEVFLVVFCSQYFEYWKDKKGGICKLFGRSDVNGTFVVLLSQHMTRSLIKFLPWWRNLPELRVFWPVLVGVLRTSSGRFSMTSRAQESIHWLCPFCCSSSQKLGEELEGHVIC